jgi:outer membrane protein assembly factor BamB
VEGGKVLVVVNGGDYVLAALSPENGSILWTYKLS